MISAPTDRSDETRCILAHAKLREVSKIWDERLLRAIYILRLLTRDINNTTLSANIKWKLRRSNVGSAISRGYNGEFMTLVAPRTFEDTSNHRNKTNQCRHVSTTTGLRHVEPCKNNPNVSHSRPLAVSPRTMRGSVSSHCGSLSHFMYS